jgi:dimethylglycine dehydrogenase
MSYSVGQLHKYAVDLYKKLEEETGKNVGFSVVSNIRLASTKDRMDEYHQYAGVAQTIGVDVKFLTPDQVKEIWPLCHTDDLVGAIQHPEDGYIQACRFNTSTGNRCEKYGSLKFIEIQL